MYPIRKDEKYILSPEIWQKETTWDLYALRKYIIKIDTE
jgi:hypothetical protein